EYFCWLYFSGDQLF
nr:immunoglobulin light chain junction region [Macaca mulatta]